MCLLIISGKRIAQSGKSLFTFLFFVLYLGCFAFLSGHMSSGACQRSLRDPCIRVHEVYGACLRDRPPRLCGGLRLREDYGRRFRERLVGRAADAVRPHYAEAAGYCSAGRQPPSGSVCRSGETLYRLGNGPLSLSYHRRNLPPALLIRPVLQSFSIIY